MAEFSNPNLQGQGGGRGGGGDSSSLMVFAFLFLVILLGYQFFFKPNQPATTAPAPQSQNQNQPQPAPLAAGQAGAAGSAAQPQLTAGPASASPAAPTIAASMVTETTVENENYKIVFTNQGAQVKHWILKKYNNSAGKPLDMVQPDAAARFGLPLSLFTYEPALTTQVNQALYHLTVSGAQPSATGLAEVPATSALTFHYAMGGLDVVKIFSFDPSYLVTAEVQVKRNGEPVRALVQWPAGLGDMEEFNPVSVSNLIVPVSASSIFAWSLDGKQDSTKAKSVSGNATLDLPYEYEAVTDLYFAAAFLPDAPERTTTVTLHNVIELTNTSSDANSQRKPADVIGLAVGDTSGTTRLRIFAGPKETALLKSIHSTGPGGRPTGPSLEPLIQYTWLAIVAKPIYYALRYLRGLLGPGDYNWGWAIIIVTFIINLCMFPTRYLMLKSSFKMMGIQDKVAALKKRYEHLKVTDPKRAEMNNEMADLYKKEGINPYGSCLPMLIQMPILYGIYRVLANAVELRQAHWYWLPDLSSPDPLHILPILIIAGMFLTQYITPSPGMDRSTQRMMAIMMPVMFGFMMWNLPSGLSLYWGTGNIINLAIQIGINQTHMGRAMHAKAARRAEKKAGAPSTIAQKRR